MQVTFGITIFTFGKVFFRALAIVFAGLLKGLWLALGLLQKELFVDLCSAEQLIRIGFKKIGRGPNQPTQGKYSVTVTGAIGAVIDGVITAKSDDNSMNPGQLYAVEGAPITLSATSQDIAIRALEGGLESKLAVGDTLTFTAPIPNVNAGMVVTAETVAPVAAEAIEDYRKVVLASFRISAGSWSAADYRLVGINVAGVANIYAYPVSGNATHINVFIEAILADSSDAHGTPTPTIIDNVEAALEVKRPAQAVPAYLPIVIKTVALNVATSTFTTGEKNTILNAMRDYVSQVRPFIPAVDPVADRKDVFDVNAAISVIVAAFPGRAFGAVTMTVDGVSMASYLFDNGEIPWLDDITYV
jgi:hypothetical protein